MRRTRAAWVVGFLLLGRAGVVAADDLTLVPPLIKPTTRISQDLSDLVTPTAAVAARSVAPPESDSFTAVPAVVAGDFVVIDAAASGDPTDLEKALIALGAQDTAIAGRLVSARLPVAAIPRLEGIASLRFARQALRTHRAGQVTTQGDEVMRADIARSTFGLDGSGTTVGVVSDSFDCQKGAIADMANGDLPPSVTVLEEDPGCPSGTDEGRALLQIIHDVAPGADLMFASDVGGQAVAANRIRALRDAGANVIVDDFIYFTEPMFQDGVIAQAVDEVVASGVAYFSAAGNEGRFGYDHAFVPGQLIPNAGVPHNFGKSVLQRISSPSGSGFRIVLQWDSPFASVGGPGTTTDLDIYLLRSDGAGGFVVVASAVSDNILSGDPVEVLTGFGGGPIQCSSPQCVGFILIAHFAGPAPGRIKYILFPEGKRPTLSPAISDGTIFGHANANGAIAVGAANFKTPTKLESFSSGGTTPVLFDMDGSLLSSPDPRQLKPEIVAPDGADTTFFSPGNDTDGTGFPNFFGTSAAAPHAAGVAALLLQQLPSLTPAGVRNILGATAKNMGPAGFDHNTGFGLIQADAALGALHEFGIDSGPSGTPNPVNPSGTVNLSVTASDTFGHTLTYGWTSTCTGGLPPGSFDDAASTAPAWTAPVNASGVSQSCAFRVTVDDGHGLTRTGTHTATVLSVPRITSFAPSPAVVGTLVTINGSSLGDATAVTFAGAVPVTPALVTPTSVKVQVPAGARTGVLSVTTPAGAGPSLSVFRIAPKILTSTPGPIVGGSTAAADVVTVTGTNLVAPAGTQMVKVGTTTVPPSLIRSNTPTEVTFTVPLGARTGKMAITTVDGTATSPNDVLINQPPRATTFSPNPAPIGAPLKITGTNLLGVSLVTFSGAAPVAPLSTPTATSLQVEVPPDALAGPVTLGNPIGTATSTAIFKILPQIIGFAPPSVVGGSEEDVVTVSGTNLRALTGNPTVKVGTTTVPASLILTSTPTQLTFKAPLGATTGKIAITTTGGTGTSTDSLVVSQQLRATGFNPNPVALEATLVIAGTNLLGVSLVTFSGAAPVAPLPTPAATSLQVVVPADALAGPVTLTDGVKAVASTAILKIAPKIDSFTPGTAVGGSNDLVTVNGTNLRAATGEPTVKIGTTTVPASLIQSSTPTQLIFKVPLGAVTSKITVTTAGGTATSEDTLTVQQPPRMTRFSPAAGTVGALLTIAGTNLLGVTEVTFTGGVAVAPDQPPTATSLRVTVPDGAEAGPVTLTNAVGTTTSVAIFKLPPTITGFDPPVASLESAVVVTGTNLKAGSADPVVKVGPVQAVVVASSPTEITFTVPLLAVTSKITVTNAGGVATSGPPLTVMP